MSSSEVGNRVDKSVWGPIFWNFLHAVVGCLPATLTYADVKKLQNTIYSTIESIPCAECKLHSKAYMLSNPTPGWSVSRTQWQEWMKNFHVFASPNHPRVWTVAKIDSDLLHINPTEAVVAADAPTTVASMPAEAQATSSSVSGMTSAAPKPAVHASKDVSFTTSSSVTAPLLKQQSLGFVLATPAAIQPASRATNMNHPSMVRSTMPAFASQKPLATPIAIRLGRTPVVSTAVAPAGHLLLSRPSKKGCGCSKK